MRKLTKLTKRNAKPAAEAAPAPAVETAPAAKPATKPASAPASLGGFTLGNITRTAKTIAADRTNFGGVSDRDGAYCALFVSCEANPGDTIKLGDIVEYCAKRTPAGTKPRNPFYAGSAKPHDAGAINRAARAGYLTRSSDGHSIVLTESGRERGRVVLSKLSAAS